MKRPVIRKPKVIYRKMVSEIIKDLAVYLKYCASGDRVKVVGKNIPDDLKKKQEKLIRSVRRSDAKWLEQIAQQMLDK